jgi:hypothetical protein
MLILATQKATRAAVRITGKKKGRINTLLIVHLSCLILLSTSAKLVDFPWIASRL